MKRIFILFIAALLFNSGVAFCDETSNDQGTYRISVMSEFKPVKIAVRYSLNEPLLLAVDEEPLEDHVINRDQHFSFGIDKAGIVVRVMNEKGKMLKKTVIDKKSRISFITGHTKKTYNEYTVMVNDDVQRNFTGTLQITRIFNDFLILVFVRKEQVIAETLDSQADAFTSHEALKAQAVLMRTVLFGNEGSHERGKYDLCDIEHCRVYKYRGEATERALKAVRATEDEIVVHDEHVITPYFFDTCGGYTALASTSIGLNDLVVPYIKEVKCNYCRDSKFYRYKRKIDLPTLSRIFLGHEDKGFDLKIVKFDKNKHWVDTIKIIASGYDFDIKGSKFTRLIMGTLTLESLPSGAFSVEKKGDEFVFSGKGSGHGIGMCQKGADRQAKLGKDHKKIINYYFSNVKVMKISDFLKERRGVR